MNLLITAGNTLAPLDQVRAITNIFTGRTGASIAQTAAARGHSVTLLTSHPEVVYNIEGGSIPPEHLLAVIEFRTFDDLTGLMQQEIRKGLYDVVIHCAAVSDYLVSGVFSPEAGTYFNAKTKGWETVDHQTPMLFEQKGGKIKSNEPELWVRMVRAPKLVDRIRNPWGFAGLLVKFKLEVGLNDSQLIDIAEQSRLQSDADLIVANTLEGAKHYALVGPRDGRYDRVPRRELAEYLILYLEDLNRLYRATGVAHG
jgi:phosphopantothenate---cysteine ligase (CTP)